MTTNNSSDIYVFIPQFCYCSAKGSNELKVIADEIFNSNNETNLIYLTNVRDIFIQHYGSLINPKSFLNTIHLIFDKIRMVYSLNDASMIINSLKRLMSLITLRMSLERTYFNNAEHSLFNDYNEWFDFMNTFKNMTIEMDAIMYKVNSERNHFAFSPVQFEGNEAHLGTEVLSSQIPDYWVNEIKLD